MKFTNIKAKITGSKMKIMLFEKPFAYGYLLKQKHRSRSFESSELRDPEVSAQKSRTSLKDIIEANNAQHINAKTKKPYQPQFMTFTFKERITDPKVANRLYRAAVKRMNRRLGFTLIYSVVPEYQKEIDLKGNPGGRLHFHVLFYNLPFTKDIYKTFLKLWGYGGIYNHSLRKIRNISAYVTKYMQKSFQEKHVKFKKRFFCSREILRPRALHREQEIVPLAKYLEKNYECIFKTSEYPTTFKKDQVKQFEIEAPLGTNILALLNIVPMDSAYLAQKILGAKIIKKDIL